MWQQLQLWYLCLWGKVLPTQERHRTVLVEFVSPSPSSLHLKHYKPRMMCPDFISAQSPKSHLWLWQMMTMVMCYHLIMSSKEWAPFLGLSLPPRPSQVDPNPCITQISESKTYIVKAMKSKQDKIGIQPGIGRVWDRRSEEPCKLFVCRDLISLG